MPTPSCAHVHECMHACAGHRLQANFATCGLRGVQSMWALPLGLIASWQPSISLAGPTQTTPAGPVLKQATTPLITSLSIRLLYFDDPEEPRHWDTVGQDAHRILSAFPAAATLRHLRFNARTNDSDADVVLPGLLPSFFLRGAARLAALETVHLEIQAVGGCVGK